jgi:hypothetical protein
MSIVPPDQDNEEQQPSQMLDVWELLALIVGQVPRPMSVRIAVDWLSDRCEEKSAPTSNLGPQLSNSIQLCKVFVDVSDRADIAASRFLCFMPNLVS